MFSPRESFQTQRLRAVGGNNTRRAQRLLEPLVGLSKTEQLIRARGAQAGNVRLPGPLRIVAEKRKVRFQISQRIIGGVREIVDVAGEPGATVRAVEQQLHERKGVGAIKHASG